jgi:hypothetical protein
VLQKDRPKRGHVSARFHADVDVLRRRPPRCLHALFVPSSRIMPKRKSEVLDANNPDDPADFEPPAAKALKKARKSASAAAEDSESDDGSGEDDAPSSSKAKAKPKAKPTAKEKKAVGAKRWQDVELDDEVRTRLLRSRRAELNTMMTLRQDDMPILYALASRRHESRSFSRLSSDDCNEIRRKIRLLQKESDFKA